MVAPYSEAMFAIVARSGTLKAPSPGPVNSTIRPTTPTRRSSSVSRSATSVASTPGASRPDNRTPTTSGAGRLTGWPSTAAVASMSPTPQPTTASALIMVV
jgi:hypothetical protein